MAVKQLEVRERYVPSGGIDWLDMSIGRSPIDRVRVTPEKVSRLGEAFPSLAWPSTRKAETPTPVRMA